MSEHSTESTATFISEQVSPTRAMQRLYAMSPPLAGHAHVVVSAAVVFLSGPETYIFPSDASGDITDWTELEGSQRGTLDGAVLAGLGYSEEVAK